MDSVIKKVLFKGDGKNVIVAIRPGYATQGEVLVTLPNAEENVDLSSMPLDPLAHVPQKTYSVATEISFVAKLAPTPGKNVVRLEYIFVENGKIIFTETIEKTLTTFDRYSNIYILEKEPPQQTVKK